MNTVNLPPIGPPPIVLRADARNLPLDDSSVDLVVTSPPYFGLRSYTDGGKHYEEQLGAEATPAEFVDALIDVTRECMRVLKPSGSIWVNLGDKYGRPGGGSDVSARSLAGAGRGTTRRVATPAADGVREKSLIGVPWRYAIRCIDDLGLILRAEVIWSKVNGLPESVNDRVRRSHEQWFHFTKEPRYFSAVDEVREEYLAPTATRSNPGQNRDRNDGGGNPLNAADSMNPLGKLPGSVWTVPTEPLRVPEHLGVDHFAAFPTEFPRRIIGGWSPRGVCVECGEGRRPVVASVGLNLARPQARRAQELAEAAGLTEDHFAALLSVGVSDTGRGAATQTGTGKNTPEVYGLADEARAALGGYAREYLLRRPTGFSYACACPQPTAPTTPARVLDPFGGTGTTAHVAHALGRQGISVDLSHDYCRIARDPDVRGQRVAKVRGIKREKRVEIEGQEDLFGGAA